MTGISFLNTAQNLCAPLISNVVSFRLRSTVSSGEFNENLQLCISKLAEYTFCDSALNSTSNTSAKSTLTTCLLNNLSQSFPEFKRLLARSANELIAKVINTTSDEQLSHYADCTEDDCPDLDRQSMHPRALDAAKIIARNDYKKFLDTSDTPLEWIHEQEALRFRYDDLREKMLITVASSDHNGAMKPGLISGILSTLAALYDIKYAVISHKEQLCQLMQAATKVGQLTNVILIAHGNPTFMSLDDREGISYKDDFSCFSALAPHGQISLFSCSTGKEDDVGYPLKNIAQKIANSVQRTVVAPVDLLYPVFTSVLNPEQSVFFHPYNRFAGLLPFYNYNLFKPFHPAFNKCTPIVPEDLHNREIEAGKAIYQELLKNHLISDSAMNIPQQYLQHCRDNPKEKFLFLSALDDDNCRLHPIPITQSLSGLAHRFDFKYKVVRTYEEVCSEIQKASQRAPLKGVILHGTSYPNQPMKLSTDPSNTKSEHLNQSATIEMLASCISNIDRNGAFVFLGGSIGALPPHKEVNTDSIFSFKAKAQLTSLAQQIKELSQRTILASVCKIYGNDIYLQSADPLILHSPAYSFALKYWNDCQSNVNNLIQEYLP